MEKSINQSFQLASDFINYTNTSVFLTGKAGTGKTTFLKHCKENTSKNTAVVAPTGVAAMNAGGTTIHSFFQLPFTPFCPVHNTRGNYEHINDKQSLVGRVRLNNERRDVLKNLELLIIDEISMVRCDILDAIDTILRSVRNQYSRPFGGVQLLLIGDMYQLSPVTKDEEWGMLSAWYKSPYFFNSHVIESQSPVYIELDKIYRQNDPEFVNVLNQVRNNEVDETGYNLLHSRYKPDYNPLREDNYITLTTHNNKADTINAAALTDLKTKEINFKALIEGEFSERSFPADEQLKLKVGAQVMFIKNDLEKPRRYFNGKIGIVEKIDDDKIIILCKGDTNTIEVRKEKWRNIRYVTDKITNQVDEEEIGSFTQFPIRLAWAITIHKSQGLTFEKAVIDAGSAFAPGQVYVALSRCTTLEGIILHSRINQQSLHSDSRIISFAKQQATSTAQVDLLIEAKRQFQKDILVSLFTFTDERKMIESMSLFITEHQDAFNKEATFHISQMLETLTSVDLMGTKFLPQLIDLIDQHALTENNQDLQLRLQKASAYFSDKLDKVKIAMEQSIVVTEKKTTATDYNKLQIAFYNDLCFHLHLLNGCITGFIIDKYIQHKRSYHAPVLKVNAYAGKSSFVNYEGPNPELYHLLRDKRDEICNEKNIPLYLVANSNTLKEMALYLPQNLAELNQVSGFGPTRTKQYGADFLSIIRSYCEAHNLQTNISSRKITKVKKESTREQKTDTKKASFDLYKAGKTIDEIVIERNLARVTVEGHLSYFIETGEVDINNLLPKEKQQLVLNVLEKDNQQTIKDIKDLLPTVSYGEIKMVVAAFKTDSTKTS
ncbi:MAG: helix-turn-helix domain-containing protein [Ferruginibacter sp.]